ncbi:MAG: hypothetical protein K2G60_01280 [Oscillospiraceae bacterium]|nr:hypothetical protein [Oscillospiraceae bacterium]
MNLIEIQKGSTYYALPKVIDYQVQYCKLWSSDTGRSMTGENKGTLIGIFPKIVIKLGQMTENEMSLFLSLVNQANANVKYYDTEYKKIVTASFYFGDAQDELKKQKNMTHKPISISIISNKKRGKA